MKNKAIKEILIERRFSAVQIQHAAGCSIPKFLKFYSILFTEIEEHRTFEEGNKFSLLDAFRFRTLAVLNGLGVDLRFARLIAQWICEYAIRAVSHAPGGYADLRPLWWAIPGIADLVDLEDDSLKYVRPRTVPTSGLQPFALGQFEEYLTSATLVGGGVILIPVSSVLQHVSHYLLQESK